MKKLLNKGFSAIEVLLVLVATGLVGFVGWYVWHNRAKTTDSTSTSTVATTVVNSPPKTTKPASIDTTKYLEIEGWGFKVPLSPSVKGLSYTLGKASVQNGDVASFRSSALDAAGTINNCKANNVDVARGTANQYVPNETGSHNAADTYKAVFMANKKSPTGVKINLNIGDFYFVQPGYRGVSCVGTNNQKLLDAEQKATDDIWTALNKIVEAK